MYLSHFVHSSFSGHLDCFCLLAVVTMLLGTWVYQNLLETLLSVLWSVYPEVDLLECMVILFVIFEESPYCFAQQWPHFTFPPTVYRGLQFLQILSVFTLFWGFFTSCPFSYKVVFCVVLICISQFMEGV